MTKDNRIEEYRFSISNLTATAGQQISAYTTQPIIGEIVKIELHAGNYATAGSLFMNISGGAAERVWVKVNNVDASSTHYPVAYPELGNGTSTGSPTATARLFSTAPLLLTGSGLGAGKSGLGVYVYYRN